VKLFRLLLTGVAAAALLFGCGEGSETGTGGTSPPNQADSGDRPPSGQKPLRAMQMTIDEMAGPEAAGLLLADYSGFFREEGIEMTILGPVNPDEPIGYAAQGASDVVVSHAPELVRARAAGLPVVAFGSLIPEPTMAMIWLPDSGIESVADLKGKTIAIPGVPFQKDFLEAVLRRAGLTLADVKLKIAGYKLLPALERGRVDAIFGGSGNVEGAALEAKGLEPVITPVSELGIPAYDELVFITRRDRVGKDASLLRRFLKAALRGNAALAEDPEAATDAVVTKTLELAPVKETTAGVEATAPLFSKTGQLDRAQAKRLIDWMHRQGMIERKPSVSALISD
jgi:putative hydroxymethylpyrimidine transport system substrate-binding protein